MTSAGPGARPQSRAGGGASKNTTKPYCAMAATLRVADRSDRWAAADMAIGKMALEPTPISAKPSIAVKTFGATVTAMVPISSTLMSQRAVVTGPKRCTTWSAMKRVLA
ncbi:MAG: hypothetical protein K0U53_06215 [Betaproteobacteria bacterium]|nr:hypothetical protein [Betaproteobacteria bacterium]